MPRSWIGTTRVRRAGNLMGVLLAGVTIISGCTTPSGTPASPKTAQSPNAVAYAQCMRDNGVSGFPDPNANGEFEVDGGSLGAPMDSDQYKNAEQTCKPLLPKKSEAQQQTDYKARLAYTKCMRKEGLSGFPDPPAPGGGDTTNQDNSGGDSNTGIDPNSAQFKSAHKACADLLPADDEGPSLSRKQ